MYDFDRQSKRLHIVPSILLYTDSRLRYKYMIGRQCDRQKAGTELYVTSWNGQWELSTQAVMNNCQWFDARMSVDRCCKGIRATVSHGASLSLRVIQYLFCRSPTSMLYQHVTKPMSHRKPQHFWDLWLLRSRCIIFFLPPATFLKNFTLQRSRPPSLMYWMLVDSFDQMPLPLTWPSSKI